MIRRFWMVLVTYRSRPLMWLAVGIVGLGLLGFALGSRSLQLREAYALPFDAVGADVLRDGELLLRWMEEGEPHPEVKAVDFLRMASVIQFRNVDPQARTAEFRAFDEVQDVLRLFPNVETLEFGPGQFGRVEAASLRGLKKLRAVRVQDLPITERHVELLAGIESLATLSIQTPNLQASLEPLAGLPRLSSLSLSQGPYAMTDSPMASPFRRETLEQIDAIPSLRRLVLQPPYIPGIGYYGGSVDPHPACDPILKRNAAEVFAGDRRLRVLWIGSNQSEQQREDLRSVAAAMPAVEVHAASYDVGKGQRAVFASLVFGFVIALLMFQLVSQFSGPVSKLAPRFAGPHLTAFVGLAALGSTCCACVLRLHGVHIAAAVAGLLGVTAAVAVVHVSVNSWAIGPDGWRRFATLSSVIALAAVVASFPFLPPSAAAAFDRFLLGQNLVAAAFVAAASLAALAVCLDAFAKLHRVWAESSLPPAMTLSEFSERTAAAAARRAERAGGSRMPKGWSAAVRDASAGARRESRWEAARLWRLGQPGTPVTAVVFLIAAVNVGWARLSGGRTAFQEDFAAGYMLFMLLLAPLMIIVGNILGRRGTLGVELLRPAARRRWVHAVFLAAVADAGRTVSLGWLAAAVSLFLTGNTPAVGALIRGSAVVFAVAVLMPGLILAAVPSRGNRATAAAAFAAGFVAVVVCMIVGAVGRDGAASDPIRQFAAHPAIPLLLWASGLAALAFAYRRWLRAEFV